MKRAVAHEASCRATYEAAFGYEALLRNMENEARRRRMKQVAEQLMKQPSAMKRACGA